MPFHETYIWYKTMDISRKLIPINNDNSCCSPCFANTHQHSPLTVCLCIFKLSCWCRSNRVHSTLVAAICRDAVKGRNSKCVTLSARNSWAVATKYSSTAFRLVKNPVKRTKMSLEGRVAPFGIKVVPRGQY